MTITRSLASLLLLCSTACAATHGARGDASSDDAGPGPDASSDDAGPGPDASADDAGPDPCDGIDRACPASVPMLGTACEGDLECPYAVLTGCGGPGDSARCVDGLWQYSGFCLPQPILYRSCREPEVGPFPDATLSVAAPTRIEWGPQGGAMVALDLTIAPSDEAPRCARTRVTLTVDGESVALTHAVEMPCGRTVRLLEIVPGVPCEERMYPYAIDVEVEGVGTQHLEGELMGGPPTTPGPSPCGFAVDAGTGT